MKKLLMTLIACMAPAAAHAVPVSCVDTLGASPTLSALIGTNAGGGCYVEDKIFSNFVYSGAGTAAQPAGEVSAALPAGDIYGFLIAPQDGTWDASFSFGFTTLVCTSIAQGCIEPNPTASIDAVKLQINTGRLPNGSVFSMNYTPNVGSPFNITTLGSGDGDDESIQRLISPTVTSITALGTFNGVGGLASIENGYFQTQTQPIPEPTSMVLLGTGLLLAGRARSRKRPSGR